MEQLCDEDAAALDLDRHGLRYRTVAELARGDEKVIRDAGTVAVTDVSR